MVSGLRVVDERVWRKFWRVVEGVKAMRRSVQAGIFSEM
jgi:hypothetical protein